MKVKFKINKYYYFNNLRKIIYTTKIYNDNLIDI